MSSKGILAQITILILSVVVFIIVAFAPKKEKLSKMKQEVIESTRADLDKQIAEVKKEMKQPQLSIINRFETNLGLANGQAKVQWLDSIMNFWDHEMRPTISAVYAKDKALLTDKEEDYMMAGERFMGVGEFLKPEDKPWAYSEARSIFEKILERSPDNADAKINLGTCYMYDPEQQNPMQGIGLLKEVLAKDSTNTRAILQLGHFSVISGQYPKAIDRFKQALEVDPELTEAYFFIGDTYGKMGDMVNAEKYLLIYRGTLKDEEVKKQLDIYLEDLKRMSNTKN